MSYRLVGTSSAATTNILWAQLGFSQGDIVRVSSLQLEVIAAPGNTVPSQFQVGIYREAGAADTGFSTRTRVLAVPTSPLRFKLRNPRSEDWITIETASSICVRFSTFGSVAVEIVINVAQRSSGAILA